jgi:hypothetical protein
MTNQNHILKGTKLDVLKKTLVVLSVGILLGTTVTFFEDANAQSQLSSNQLKQCEYLYFNFKKFGENEFIYRYSFKSFIKECVKLYNDPEWTFEGKDKIDNYYQKQEAAKNAEPYSPSEVQLSITQKYRIGETRYVIGFEACTFDKKMQSVFLVYSDIDKFIATSQKLIPQDSCSSYWTNINANLPDSIGILYVKDLKEYTHLIKKEIKN